MEIAFYILIILLLGANLYFSLKKDDEKDNDDEYLIKGIVSEIIENEESQIYKLLDKSDQTVKDFLEKTGEIKSSISGVDQQTRNLISVLNNNQSRGQWAELQVEDLLGIMEYKDGVHYETQKIMEKGTKPDFTFYLPDDKSINMDSKFPLTIYMEISKLNRDLEDETLDEIARREITDSIKAKTKEFLDKEKLDNIRNFVFDNLLKSPLFDGKKFSKEFLATSDYAAENSVIIPPDEDQLSLLPAKYVSIWKTVKSFDDVKRYYRIFTTKKK